MIRVSRACSAMIWKRSFLGALRVVIIALVHDVGDRTAVIRRLAGWEFNAGEWHERPPFLMKGRGQCQCSTSIASAIPWPPPMQRVTRPTPKPVEQIEQ